MWDVESYKGYLLSGTSRKDHEDIPGRRTIYLTKYTLKCVGALKDLYKTCGRRWRLSGLTGKFHKMTIVKYTMHSGYTRFQVYGASLIVMSAPCTRRCIVYFYDTPFSV